MGGKTQLETYIQKWKRIRLSWWGSDQRSIWNWPEVSLRQKTLAKSVKKTEKDGLKFRGKTVRKLCHEKREYRVLKRVSPVHDNVKDTQGVSNKGFKKLIVISQLALKLGCVISVSTTYFNFEKSDYFLCLDQELFMRQHVQLFILSYNVYLKIQQRTFITCFL